MSGFDTSQSEAGRAIWIEATDGTLVNARAVQYFDVAARAEEVTPRDMSVPFARRYTVERWELLARWPEDCVPLRVYDSEDDARAGLLCLRRLLPGQHISADLDLNAAEEAL